MKIIQESFFGIREVKLFNQIGFQLNQYKNLTADFINSKSTYLIFSAIPRFLFELLIFITVISFTIFLIFNSMSIENYLALIGIFGFAAIKLLPSFNTIFQSITTIKFHKKTIESILMKKNY